MLGGGSVTWGGPEVHLHADADRDALCLGFIAAVARSVNLTHTTSADLLDDAVMPEGATDEVLHCLWLPARLWYLKMTVDQS